VGQTLNATVAIAAGASGGIGDATARSLVRVLESGGVTTELSSHKTGASRTDLDAFCASTETLLPQDIADGVAYRVTRPRRASVAELCIMHTDQA
jgi:NADP-dependent 3-hydroxy acid dehydrogenase YdfG